MVECSASYLSIFMTTFHNQREVHAEWKEVKDVPAAVGWERNLRGRHGPRIVHLASSMDPIRHVFCLHSEPNYSHPILSIWCRALCSLKKEFRV
jgi:hypothetical protein